MELSCKLEKVLEKGAYGEYKGDQLSSKLTSLELHSSYYICDVLLIQEI